MRAGVQTAIPPTVFNIMVVVLSYWYLKKRYLLDLYVCMYIYSDPFKCYTLNNSTNTKCRN